jgi:hypothetical protein
MYGKAKELEQTDDLSSPLSSNLLARVAVLNVGDACATNLLELGHKCVRLIQLFHIVATSNALADEKDVGNRPSASHVCQKSLEFVAQGFDVELDYEWLGNDAILFEQDVLGFLRVWAV